MPKPYPREFRDDVVAVARKGEAPLKQIAAPTSSGAARPSKSLLTKGVVAG